MGETRGARFRGWVLGALLLLGACAPRIYGVPQETWESMSEPQRLEAMQIYNERQLAYQRAQAERARLQAIERERERVREAEEARLRQERVEAIYRGRGHFGDLLRVTLQGGEMKIGGKGRSYEPLSFKIADGEEKTVPVVSGSRQGSLRVRYGDGGLVLDEYGRGSRLEGVRLAYSPEWASGASYTDLSTRGPADLHRVEAYVEVIGVGRPRPPHGDDRPAVAPPQIIVIQQTTVQQALPAPPVVVHSPQPAPPAVVAVPPPPPGSVTGEPPQGVTPPTVPQPEGDPLGSHVRIRIDGGWIQGRGRPLPCDPVTFTLAEGDSLRVPLSSRGRPAGELLVSYRGGVVYLDGPPDHGRGRKQPTRLPREPEWRQGKVYRLDTAGALRFKDLALRIEELDA